MKILYHHRTTAGDAQGIHIREIVGAFRELGHEVQEVSLVGSETTSLRPSKWYSIATDRPVLQEGLKLMYNPFGYMLLRQAIQNFQPDFLFERYAQHCAAGVIACRRHRIPHILEVNSPLALEEAELGRVVSRRVADASERWILSKSSRVVCVSTVLKNILVELGVPDSQVVVCTNGVDPERFHGRSTGQGVRAKYGLGSNLVLGFVGWLRDWHGLADLVKSLSKLGTEECVHLLIVGDGPARSSVERAAVQCGMQARVHITGPMEQDSVVDHIAAFDIALQPAATSYASPMKILEYMAMGKPVVAPRQDNIEEILTDGYNAALFQPQDFNDLTRVVKELAGDRSRCRSMGESGRRTIFERNYLWSANASRMIELAEREQASRA